MLESYMLDVTPYSMTLVETMRQDPLAKKLASQGKPIKLRGMVNMMNFTYGFVFSYEKGNYPMTMRWGMFLNKREATTLVSISTLDALHSKLAGRCIIPANWYYDTDVPTENNPETTSGYYIEQNKTRKHVWIGAERIGEKMVHFPVNRDPCNFGAVFCMEEGFPCFAIVIMDDGLPLMIQKKNISAWTNPEGDIRSAVANRIRDIAIDVTND
ncbi:MAG: hypothetical protein IJ242_05365 [Clostridia bacterium]|nr:hypothetical protein [Clostridia bacterium]